MPACLGVPSLQDVCLQQFCQLLSELAITSTKIVTEQAPQSQQEGGASVSSGASVRETVYSSDHGTVHKEPGQLAPAKSSETGNTETEAEEAADGGLKPQNGSSGPPTSESVVLSCPKNAPEMSTRTALELDMSQKPLCQADGPGTSGDTGDKVSTSSFLEQQQEAQSYLIYNVPPCFFEQLVHKTLGLINKHFYNPK